MDRAEAIRVLDERIAYNQFFINCAADPEKSYPESIKFCKALDMAIAALREQEGRKWISVSERLPQEYGAVCKNVILLMDDGFVTVGWLNQVTGKGYYLDAVNDDVIREPLSRFTHWMPLPEPPTEGGDSDG